MSHPTDEKRPRPLVPPSSARGQAAASPLGRLRLVTDEDAERVAAQVRDWSGWQRVDTARLEARQLTSGEWKYSLGEEIAAPGTRAAGMPRRRGWCVAYEFIATTPDTECFTEGFPSLIVARLFGMQRAPHFAIPDEERIAPSAGQARSAEAPRGRAPRSQASP